MSRSEIEKIIHTYFLRLGKQFRVIGKNMTEATIKPFRIEIKKLRAFLRLLELELTDPHDLKLPVALKEMHKSGGKFRDLLLLRQRIRKAATRKGYKAVKFLEENIRLVKKEQRRFLSNKDFAKDERNLRKKLPGKYGTETIRRFFRAKKEHILDIIRSGTYTDKELHDIRKKLKDILYIIKLYRLDIKKTTGTRLWNKATLLRVKELEDQLGFLNDSRNVLSLLTTGDINRSKAGEKEILLSVRRAVLAEKRKLKKQVLFSIKKIFTTESDHRHAIKV